MKKYAVLLLLTVFTLPALSQTRTVTGRVLLGYSGEPLDLEPAVGVSVWTDSIAVLGLSDGGHKFGACLTDIEGRFEIEFPAGAREIFIHGLGFDPVTIEGTLTGDDNYWEIIVLPSAHYDFMTWRQEAKAEKRKYEALPGLHRLAFERGLFTSPTPCPPLESRREYRESTRPLSQQRPRR